MKNQILIDMLRQTNPTRPQTESNGTKRQMSNRLIINIQEPLPENNADTKKTEPFVIKSSRP